MEKKCFIILGMHRSGTSALAAVISMLGITPGANLLPPDAEVNAKGFWEHADIVAIHDQLLCTLGSSWHDNRSLPDLTWSSQEANQCRQKILDVLHRDFNSTSTWLIKDPRMCRLLPLWWDVFRELDCQPMFILVLRHPGEVARSLRKRDDMTEEQACMLWLSNMLEAEYQTRGQPRVFVSYGRLMEDWQRVVTDIADGLGIVWPVSAEEASSPVNAFLDPSLRHYAGHTRLSEHPACRLAQEGFELLSAAQPVPSALDQLRAQVADLIALVSPWSTQLQLYRNVHSTNTRLDLENVALRAELARIKNTVSWKITKPLRAIRNIFRSLPQNDAAKQ